jgi:putative hydrolase of the HAD superfamily
MLFSLNDPQDSPQSWEEKLVYFADKLVEGSGVVTFEERLQVLQSRYKMDEALISKIGPALENLQAEICQAIRVPPGELIPKLRRFLFKGS